MNFALGYGHVLLGLEIELGGKGVASSYALDSAGVCFDVDDITHPNPLLLDSLVDAGIQPQLLCSSCRSQGDHEMRYGASVVAQGVLGLFGGEFSDFALVDFFCLLHTETNGTTEVLHQSFGLFHFGAVDFAADNGAEGDLGAEFL